MIGLPRQAVGWMIVRHLLDSPTNHTSQQVTANAEDSGSSTGL